MYNKKHSNLATIEGAYRTDFGLNHRSAGDAATWLLGIKKKLNDYTVPQSTTLLFFSLVLSPHTPSTVLLLQSSFTNALCNLVIKFTLNYLSHYYGTSL